MFTVMKMSSRRILMDPKEYLFGFVLLQSIRFAVALPLISFLFYMMLNSAGIVSITNTNVVQIVSSPLAVIILLILLLILTFFIFYEFGYYFILAKYQRLGENFTFRTILKQLHSKIPKFFSLHFLLFTIYLCILLPIASLGMSTSWTEQLQIPYFITDELMNTLSGKVLLAVSLLVILYMNIRFIFTLLYFSTESDCSLRNALLRSWVYSRGKVFRIMISLGTLLLTYSIASIVLMGFILSPVFLLESYFDIQLPILAGISFTIIQAVLFIMSALLQPMLTEAITIIERGEEKIGKLTSYRKTIGHYVKRFWPLLVLVFVTFSVIHTNTLKETVYQPMTKIVAHRGYSAVALENTIASLEAAAEAGADLVEMDIQETSDGKFVVYHDQTLRRLSNHSKVVGKMTLDELTDVTLSNGKYLEPLPSFEEYIDKAKELNIRLLVETKTYGHESEQMEENLIKLLQEKDVAYDYVIQSLDLKHLRKIQQIDPLIQTSDVIALNIGNVPKTESQFLSLEDFSVTNKLMRQANEKDKRIFVWTINKTDLMHSYMRMGVYGLITNQVTDAVAVRDMYEEDQGLLQRLLWMIEENI